MTNSGTLSASERGHAHIFDTTVNNAGGTISNADASSSVVIDGSTINGGNLTGAGGSAIHGINNATLNGVTITPGSTYSVDAGQTTYLTGDLINKGTVQVGASGNSATLDVNASTINLTGGGTDQPQRRPVVPDRSRSPGQTLVNKDNTIQGQGSIFQPGLVPEPGHRQRQRLSGKNSSSKVDSPTVTNTGPWKPPAGAR